MAMMTRETRDMVAAGSVMPAAASRLMSRSEKVLAANALAR
jgi:hypothetical protein